MGKNSGVRNEQVDPRWPKLLSLAVHEFRTPITVVAGYLRMVLKERAGPISEQQRKLLEEAEKSCGRLSGLVTEMSELSALESGSAALTRMTVDLGAVLTDVVRDLPELPDRVVPVALEGVHAPVPVPGDQGRLHSAFRSLLTALRREVVTDAPLVIRVSVNEDGAECVVTMADASSIDSLAAADRASLERFDEWRGGSGLSLAIARRIFDQHGGTLLGPPGGEKAGAILRLPRQ